MNNDEVIGKLHRACTQIRLAIAVYETPNTLEEGESTSERLADAVRIVQEVREHVDSVKEWAVG